MKNIYELHDYPNGIDYFVKRNITSIGNWDILHDDILEFKLKSIQDRYPKSNLLPFAYNEDNDFLACFKQNEGNKVFIILDYSEEGKEVKEILESVEKFVNKALANWIDEKLLNDESDNETLEEISGLFGNLKVFSNIVKEVDFNKEGISSYSFDNKYYINILEKKNFSIKEGFARLFKEELFNSEGFSRDDEEKYKKDNWDKYIESFWIPEYFLSYDSLDILNADILPFKKEILNLNNMKDENMNSFYIEENEFDEAEVVVYKRKLNDSSAFINTKNYYIDFNVFY